MSKELKDPEERFPQLWKSLEKMTEELKEDAQDDSIYGGYLVMMASELGNDANVVTQMNCTSITGINMMMTILKYFSKELELGVKALESGDFNAEPNPRVENKFIKPDLGRFEDIVESKILGKEPTIEDLEGAQVMGIKTVKEARAIITALEAWIEENPEK